MSELTTNVLYYGDNLDILRKHIPDESVDLVYLDPPFNSKADYNVLFKEPTGELSAAQLRAFTDSWHWDTPTERTFCEIVEKGPPQVAHMIGALREFLDPRRKGHAMMAYLVMMTVRLVELRRVLKPTGSLYLHCDPTASHYLKVVLDTIFGAKNFRNEIVWRRYGAHNDVGQGSMRFGRVHDILLLYGKQGTPYWQQIFVPLDPANIASTYRYAEPTTGRRFTTTPLTGPGGEAKGNPVYEWKGHTRAWRYSRETMERLDQEGRFYYSRSGYVRQKLYLDETRGVPVQDVWDDIHSLSGSHKERLGYQTQKPLALLERIIQASSNEGDVVLDPFCGCGTAVVAAHKLGRRWIGIDLTHLAITVMKKRLLDSFELRPGRDYQVVGEPVDLAGARALAAQDRYEFQYWAVSLVVATPAGDDRKKGADSGVDGVIGFVEQGGKARRIIVQVKSGHVNVTQVRDLKGTMEREKAELGLFIALESPTAPMRTEAVSAGFYHSELWKEDYPRLQICTVAELLAGKLPRLPRHAYGGFARAERIKAEEGKQEAML